MRLEDAPNKLVHADDLAEALAKLRHRRPAEDNSPAAAAAAAAAAPSPVSPTEAGGKSPKRGMRSRSSTLIYMPDENGPSPDLPAIAVEDMTEMEVPEPLLSFVRRLFGKSPLTNMEE